MKSSIHFAPMLYIDHGISDISFYTKAFNSVEQFRFSNDDGSLHVAELKIDDAEFHVHEKNHDKGRFTPIEKGVSVTIGLFVDDVHAVFNQAITAGAKVLSPVTDYEYGYRQGDLEDPFGHVWTIQKKI